MCGTVPLVPHTPSGLVHRHGLEVRLSTPSARLYFACDGELTSKLNLNFATVQWLLQALNQGLEIIRVCVVWQPGDAVMMGCEIRLLAVNSITAYQLLCCHLHAQLVTWAHIQSTANTCFYAYMLTEVY